SRRRAWWPGHRCAYRRANELRRRLRREAFELLGQRTSCARAGRGLVHPDMPDSYQNSERCTGATAFAAPGRAWPRLAAPPGALGSAGAETDRQGGAGDGRRRRLAIAMPTALTLALATVE